MKALEPSATLLIKLGSLIVHLEEALSGHLAEIHPLDAAAIAQLQEDPEVREWIAEMDAAALLPKKR